MEKLDEIVGNVISNMETVREFLDEESEEFFKDAILRADRIFVVGDGISGLVAKGFAMRLVDLGFETYFLHDNMFPSMTNNDCIVAVSGSANSQSTLHAAHVAKNKCANVLVITSFPDSDLGHFADCCIVVPGRNLDIGEKDYFKRELEFQKTTDSEFSNMFEICVMIFFEALVFELEDAMMFGDDRLEKEHDLLSRHTVLE